MNAGGGPAQPGRACSGHGAHGKPTSGPVSPRSPTIETLELEYNDRLSLNVSVPLLHSPAGMLYFFRQARDHPAPSSALMTPMTRRFVEKLERYAQRERVNPTRFERTRRYLHYWHGGEGVLDIGKVQERTRVVRTERRHDPLTGATIRGWFRAPRGSTTPASPWSMRTSARGL